MTEVRLTYSIARVPGLPNRPETLRPGYKRTLICSSWRAALDHIDDLAERLAAEGRRINQATITDLDVADRQHQHATEGNHP